MAEYQPFSNIFETLYSLIPWDHNLYTFLYFFYFFYFFYRSWQADTPGSNIVFKFFGSTVKIAIWQRRDGMGVIHAHVDDNKKRIAKASGFFKGYTWAMEKNNTGGFSV